MEKKSESRCKICRASGEKLFLKGARCYTNSCSVTKGRQRPGQHGKIRIRKSDFYFQLQEKQKAKQIYGIREKQFKIYVIKAEKLSGIAGDNVLQLLERRLDNVVYRLGFSNSRKEARQLVRHRHFLVNGKIIDIPSYLVCVDDEIELKEKGKKNKKIRETVNLNSQKGIPPWLELNVNELKGKVLELPTRDKIDTPLNMELIIGFYSR